MTTAITAQNGARLKPTVKVGVEGCKHNKSKRRKKHRRELDSLPLRPGKPGGHAESVVAPDVSVKV